MSSVRDIASDAGVSISTVSRVLNNDSSVHPDTRDRVLAVANKKGYTPSVGRRITTHIGLAYTQEMTLSHPYDATVVEGIMHGLNERRFDLVLLNLNRDKRSNETYTQFFIRKGVRGVILRTMKESRSVCEAIADEGFPHVVVSERFDSPNVSCIDCDSKPDSVRAVDYLIRLGHRRIGFGAHNVSDLDHIDRHVGYLDALKANGLPIDDDLVFWQPFTLSGGATVMDMAMNLAEPPTAFYFADPLLAVGAIKRAHEMGIRIPEDLSIVGFDDTDIRHSVYPTMTAVCQEASVLGLEAALWLTRILTDGKAQRLSKAIPTFFEINETTAPPSSNPGLQKRRNNGAGAKSASRSRRRLNQSLAPASDRLGYAQSGTSNPRKAEQ
ncbi:MAG TPA: LacI family DNA-binding transcriptional regulator [Phycisphaerae bacterium]|nr:LacI family DNA-binding transcriptional regulator [Phycisphaerae bacterium]HRW52687.1 LacI family DNA-binding transcriptional regulator [Phycisphaerae bacterium]